MNIVLLGPPASGKGTCSKYLSEKYNFIHISMGDLLRNYAKSQSPLAEMVNQTISQGKILKEEITAEILYDYLKKENIFDNILFDGYPRGMKSVDLMQKFIKVDKVIVLKAEFETIKARILNRMICSNCGKVFSSLDYKESSCDRCNAPLMKRSDDNIESLTTRMKEYESITMPVINHYDKIGMVYYINSNDDYKKQLDKLMETLK